MSFGSVMKLLKRKSERPAINYYSLENSMEKQNNEKECTNENSSRDLVHHEFEDLEANFEYYQLFHKLYAESLKLKYELDHVNKRQEGITKRVQYLSVFFITLRKKHRTSKTMYVLRRPPRRSSSGVALTKSQNSISVLWLSAITPMDLKRPTESIWSWNIRSNTIRKNVVAHKIEQRYKWFYNFEFLNIN